MGTISLYRLNSRDVNGWSGWSTVTGYSWACNYYSCYPVLAATMYLNNSPAMYSCSVSASFANVQGGSHSARINCYLYTNPPSDPTEYAPSSPPSGYLQKVSTTVYLNSSSATRATFNFENLNFSAINQSTGGAYVFFWFEVESNGTYIDGAYWQAYSGGPSGISAPSVSAVFDLPTLSMSVTPSELTTGNAVTVDIANGSTVTGKTLQIKHVSTNTVLYSHSIDSSLSITCPKSWFDTVGITTQQQMSLRVTVTYSQGGQSKTLTGDFTLKAGTDMNPVVGTPTASIVQGASAATAFPNTYIAGISKVKVEAAVTFPTNSGAQSVVLSYPGGTNVNMTYNSSTGKYEGTTAAPITQNTPFLVTATDQRGLTGTKTVSVTGVVAYVKPSIAVAASQTYRCNSSGVQESGGRYYRVKATYTVYSATGFNNPVKQFNVKVEGQSATTNLTSGQQSAAIDGNFNENYSYTIVITVEDQISGPITKEVTFEGKLRNMVWKRSDDGTYVGIGKTPETSSGGSTLELPHDGNVYIGGIDLGSLFLPCTYDLTGTPFDKDFLKVDSSDPVAVEHAGAFFYRPKADLSLWSNGPATNDDYNWRGYRFVLWYNTQFQLVIVIELFPYPGRIWSNFHNGTSGWVGWRYTSAVTPSS